MQPDATAAIQRPSNVQVFRSSTGRVRIAFDVDDELVSRLVQSGRLNAIDTERNETLAGAVHALLCREPSRAEKPDFPKIIAELRARYLASYGTALTDYKLARIVAKRIGRPVYRRAIANAAAGTQPQHDVGEALREIYGRFTPPSLNTAGD